MPTNNAGSLADEMERLRSGNESFLPELGKMNSRAAFMDKHFDTILNALRASPSVDQGVVQEDEAFSAAVWDALKGDHNDLRKQAIILRAHRAALRRFASPQTVGEVGEDKAGGLWYRRWFKASVELNEALSRVAELERENFTLAAGQCIVERGLLGDEHGHQFCALTAERDAALVRCEGLLTRFLPAILHGDDEHRAWLTAAVEAYLADQPIPSPAGSGRKDALIASLEARCERLEGVVKRAASDARLASDALGNSGPEFRSVREAFGIIRDRARAALGEGGDQTPPNSGTTLP
jgi:hypothetical protein